MRALKFAGGLLAAILLHVVGVRLFDGFPGAFDLFLLVTVLNALGGSLMAGMLGGLAAGLAADAFGGGLYGLNGFADTMIGYGAAFAAQRLVIQRATGVLLFFGLAVTLHQAVVMGLTLLLEQDPALPDSVSIAVRIVATSLLGVAVFFGRGRIRSVLTVWRRNRSSRLR